MGCGWIWMCYVMDSECWGHHEFGEVMTTTNEDVVRTIIDEPV